MNHGNVFTASISETADVVKVNTEKTIPVSVHIPENISESTRKQKINRIYDILKSENTTEIKFAP